MGAYVGRVERLRLSRILGEFQGRDEHPWRGERKGGHKCLLARRGDCLNHTALRSRPWPANVPNPSQENLFRAPTGKFLNFTLLAGGFHFLSPDAR